MKQIIIILSLIINSTPLFSQLQKGGKKCYEGNSKNGQKYTEWQCGKTPGVVDCNGKIDFDERSKTFTSSAGGKPYTGQCETCYENGMRERFITFQNGKEVGTDTTKYMSGCPMVIRTHIEGFENGTWTYFYDSTNIVAWEMNYLVGQKHGKFVYFNRAGDTTLFENYSHDQLQGTKRIFFSNGKIKRAMNYTKGNFDGNFTSYNKDGKIIEKLSFKNGKKDGMLTYYYDDGTLLKTEYWLNDVKNGPFTSYYYQGFVQTLENYKKGVKDGWFEEYYPNRKLKIRSLYKKGVLIEEHEFNEKGKEIRTFPEVQKEETKSEDDEIELEENKDKKKKKEKKKKEEEVK
jgi:antitoxin component YwqK of YwqJK toxin-antitoxin module